MWVGVFVCCYVWACLPSWHQLISSSWLHQSCSMPEPNVVMQLGLTVVSNLAATAEGAALLLKSPLLAKTAQQLHHSLQRREGPRTAALLGPLVNLAVHTEEQKHILRAASAPGPLPQHPACITCCCLMLIYPNSSGCRNAPISTAFAASCTCLAVRRPDSGQVYHMYTMVVTAFLSSE